MTVFPDTMKGSAGPGAQEGLTSYLRESYKEAPAMAVPGRAAVRPVLSSPQGLGGELGVHLPWGYP